VSREGSHQWRTLSAAEKEPFMRLAADARAKYTELMNEFNKVS